MSIVSEDTVNVRYMVDDVQAAIDFYTTHLGFTLNTAALPAFADVIRGNLRLLLAGAASSAGRRKVPVADPVGHPQSVAMPSGSRGAGRSRSRRGLHCTRPD